MNAKPLAGKVALVTGASRGVGRGVAEGLGEAGATVFVTGRSSRAGGSSVPNLAGTVEDTAEAVTALGGRGVPLTCDHRSDEDTRKVFEGILAEAGRLDVLVNNVWGGYELFHAGRAQEYNAPFWEQDLSLWDSMFATGVRAHYACSRLAAPLMLERGGLIVNVSFFAGLAYRPGENVAYSVAKAADDRMTEGMAWSLRERHVAVVSLYPGLVRTEGVMLWKEYFDLSNSESPRFSGRAVAALAADARVMERSGSVVVSAELAAEYGFTDLDDSRPRSLRPDFERPPA